MSFSIHDIDSDSASIHDVLLCWESSEDDSDLDSVDLIPPLGEVGGNKANVVPASPREDPTPSLKGVGGKLANLMRKYPDFVPGSLPLVARKRSRPICLFVNYMGTRRPIPPKTKNTPVKAKSKAKAKSKKQQTFKASPYPSDAPMPQAKPAKKKRRVTPSAVQLVTPTGSPTATPTPAPVVTPTLKLKKISTVLHVSPMPTLGPTIPRKSVTPPPQEC